MKVQITFLLIGIITVPLYAQELPLLEAIPQVVIPTNDSPQAVPPVEEIEPVIVTQMVTQIQMLTQTVTNTVVETLTNIISDSGVSKKKSKEIKMAEYKAAKRILYQKMRASESMFRRTGWWLDGSFISSSTYITGSHNRLELLGAYVSWGRIIKGLMFGLSYQYTASDYTSVLRLPSLHEGSFVFGYRIAPDKGIGLRLMFHGGVGSSFGKTAVGSSFSTPLKYVILMPEIKLDIRLYKSFVFTFGVGYKGILFLSNSKRFQNALVDEFGFNTLRGLRYSMGLAISY